MTDSTLRHDFNEFRWTERYQPFWDFVSEHGELAGHEDEPLSSRYVRTVGSDEDAEALKRERLNRKHWLSRFYPYNQQDLMFVGLEPRLDVDTAEIKALADKPESVSSIPQLADISSKDWIEYDHLDKLEAPIRALSTEASLTSIDSFETFDAYLRSGGQLNTGSADVTQGLYADFYISNLYPIADFQHLTSDRTSKVELYETLVAEIRKVDPDLVVLSSGAWTKLVGTASVDDPITRGQLRNPADGVPVDGKLAKLGSVHGSLYEGADGRYYIPTYHLNPQGQTWPSDSPLLDSCREVSRLLAYSPLHGFKINSDISYSVH